MSTETEQYRASQTVIELTSAAQAHVIKYLQKRGNGKGVRISLAKTGCSGLSYVVDYVDELTAGDIEVRLNDEYRIFIERKSYPYLKGCKVDYVKQGLNYKFEFTNPNQTGACGCGESFTVE